MYAMNIGDFERLGKTHCHVKLALEIFMPNLILKTKISLPVKRNHLVVRSRLHTLLSGAMRQERKLILISAPAGFWQDHTGFGLARSEDIPAAWYPSTKQTPTRRAS